MHGALLDALDDADLLAPDPKLRAHGRLDAGVSARDHPVALDAHGSLETLARTLAGTTEGIVPWAGARVHEGHDPRTAARSRTYRYLIPRVREEEAATIEHVWSLFQGSHDVSEFARLDAGRDPSPQRTITRTRAWRSGPGLVLEVQARSFLRHQVRRMVGACRTVARGEVPVERVREALAGGSLGTYEVAPAEGLVLWRVAMSAPWSLLDEAREAAASKLEDRLGRARQRVFGLEAALGGGGVSPRA